MNAREGMTVSGAFTADAPVGLLEKTIRKVPQLLTLADLHIPEYQRPYKWTGKHVHQLLADLATHQDKMAYRLGTVVLHKDEKGKLNIVDGQQRTVTLLLLVHALLKHLPDTWEGEDKGLRQGLEALGGKLFNPQFPSDLSRRNVWLNYQEIVRHVGRLGLDEVQALVHFLLHRCELVCVTLGSVSEAFQFFDAQNARGLDLNPHDLLKAFHLREFSDEEKALQAQTVRVWEACSGDVLAQLFADYLYRVRQWCRGRSARSFGKEQTGLFKGVTLHRVKRYRFVQPLRMVDDYSRHMGQRMDGASMEYPFQLDAPMVNGRRFFEWVAHYQSQGFHREPGKDGALAWTGSLGHALLTGRAPRILQTLESYPGRHRQGDRYVRCMFDCLLMYYIDRFGHEQLSAAIEKAFIWAYRVRLEMYAVQLATMDNHVLKNNVFSALREAVEPGDFLQHSLPAVKPRAQSESKKPENLEALVALFKEMNYWEAGDAKTK